MPTVSLKPQYGHSTVERFRNRYCKLCAHYAASPVQSEVCTRMQVHLQTGYICCNHYKLMGTLDTTKDKINHVLEILETLK